MILEYYLCIAICDGKFNSDYWLSCVLRALGCYGLCYNKVNEVTIETIWIRRSWLVKCFFFQYIAYFRETRMTFLLEGKWQLHYNKIGS